MWSGIDDLVGRGERDGPDSPCCSLSWVDWLADAECSVPLEWTALWTWYVTSAKNIMWNNEITEYNFQPVKCKDNLKDILNLNGSPCFMFWLPDWCWGDVSPSGLWLLFCQLGGVPGMGPRAWIILSARQGANKTVYMIMRECLTFKLLCCFPNDHEKMQKKMSFKHEAKEHKLITLLYYSLNSY